MELLYYNAPGSNRDDFDGAGGRGESGRGERLLRLRAARVASQTNPLDWYECQAQAPAATTPTRRRRLTSAEPDDEEASSFAHNFSMTGSFATMDGGSGLTVLTTSHNRFKFSRYALESGSGPSGSAGIHDTSKAAAVANNATQRSRGIPWAPCSPLTESSGQFAAQ